MNTRIKLIISATVVVLVSAILLIYHDKNKQTSTVTTTLTTTMTTTVNEPPPTYDSLNELANKINAKLPVKVDDYTTMEHVEVSNAKTINYHYMLSDKFFSQSNLNEFNTIFVPKLKNNLCHAPELQYLIQNNVDLNYLYHQDANKVFAQFVVNKKECLN
jgi:hypothetical protein